MIEKSNLFMDFPGRFGELSGRSGRDLAQKTRKQLAECGQPGYFNDKVTVLTIILSVNRANEPKHDHEVMR